MNDLISRKHFDERVRLAGGMANEELTQDFKDGVLTVLEMLKTEPSIRVQPAQPKEAGKMEGQMKEHEKLVKMLDTCDKNDVDGETLKNCLLGSIASSLAIIADIMTERRTDETNGNS